ncbi:alpha/beta hydrolase [Deltaproteobacteria bacterium TL4]
MRDLFYQTLITTLEHTPQIVLQQSVKLVHTATQIPVGWFSLLSGETDVQEGRILHPQFQMLIRLNELFPSLEKATVVNARQFLKILGTLFSRNNRKMRFVKNLSIPGVVQPIPLRVYIPKTLVKPAPVLIYFHGGGWTVGDLDTHDGLCRLFAEEGRFVVVAVDYRLAPEHKFPAALEDAYTAYLWIRRNVSQLEGHPSKIAVGGDSVGANLATLVCYRAKLDNLPLPCYQMLLYPVTDLRVRTRSYDVFKEGFFLTRSMMKWFIENYLNDPTEASNPQASPLLIKNLKGFPPTLLTTAGFDPLHDEGAIYAERLRAADVPVTYKSYDGFPHAYLNFIDIVPAVNDALLETVKDLRSALF